MSVSQRQMVEIARAVSYNSKIIVLDEPTSSLTEPEVKKLFKIVNELRERGVSFVYISHKMDEIFQICDEVSVLRDGEMIMTKKTSETNMNELISAMVGRSLTQRFPPVDNTPGEEVLRIENLSSMYAPLLRDINFSVRKGEIFGIYGLVGAGRSELLECLFGMRTIKTGKIFYNGKQIFLSSPKDAMEYNFAFVTEERKANGMFMKGTLTFNTTITNLDKYKTFGFLDDAKMKEATIREISLMHTKCMGPNDMISALSGGNQQKVIIGKWLERDPDIFLLDEPTRGIDVGAKYEIYQIMIELTRQGKSIIMISSEMPELIGMSHRILVMCAGKMTGEVSGEEATQENIMSMATQFN